MARYCAVRAACRAIRYGIFLARRSPSASVLTLSARFASSVDVQLACERTALLPCDTSAPKLRSSPICEFLTELLLPHSCDVLPALNALPPAWFPPRNASFLWFLT